MCLPKALRLAAMLLLGTIHGGAWSQTLSEMFEAARGHDAAFLGAKALADSATYRAAQSEALQRPNVALTAETNRTQAQLPSAAGEASVRQNTNLARVGLSATLALYNPAYSATVQQAQAAVEAASTDLEAAEQDLLVRVAQAYLDVLAAQDALTTTRTGQLAISEQLASAKRNFDVGNATITDAREAQARFDLARAQVLAAETELQAKLIALEVVVGRTGLQPHRLKTPMTLPSAVPGDVRDWLNAAQERHPAVRKAKFGLDVARLETEKARAAKGATVDLTAALQRGHSTGAGAVPAAGHNTNLSVGIVLRIPLYAGGSLQNRIKETLALEDKARQELAAAERGVSQATRVGFISLQSLHAQVQALEAAESSSQLALEATQRGYKVGVRVNLDVLNAQAQLLTTQRDLWRARYDVVFNGLKLRQASGQLTASDLGDVSRLFGN
jgi:outer membrane protein